MEEIRAYQLWAVAALGALLGLGFLYLRRIDAGPLARVFGLSWLAFFAALIAAAGASAAGGTWRQAVLLVSAHGFATGFPALLCAGAFQAASRPPPRGLVPLALGLGLLRGLLLVAGLPDATRALAVAFEPGLDWLGAAVLGHAYRADRRRGALLGLSLMLGVFGLLEITNEVFGTGQAPAAYVLLGSVATLALAFVQILVVLEAVRMRERRAEERRTAELQLLREIAQTSTAPDLPSLARQALDALRGVLVLDGGGIWTCRGDPPAAVALHAFGPSRSAGPEAAPRLEPSAAQGLLAGASALDDATSTDGAVLASFAETTGLRRLAWHPLHLADSEMGLLVVGRRGGPPFEPGDRQTLAAAAEELSLALRHAAAMDRLAQERHRLRAVIDTAPVGVLIEDDCGRIVLRNASLDVHLGVRSEEHRPGSSAGELLFAAAARAGDPAEGSRLVKTLWEVGGDPEAFPAPVQTGLTLVAPVRRELLLFASPIRGEGGEPLGRVWVTRDATEEHELVEQLRQSRKMETLGTLASGIAHDFNNQLTAILGNARLLLDEVGDRPGARSALSDLERAAEHCTELTRSLLAFARRSPISRRPLVLRELLEGVEAMMRAVLPPTAVLRMEPGPGDLVVDADPTQLRQIVINLIVNARDATEGRGHIDVACRAAADPGTGARGAEIVVADDGIGMDAATRERLFDPFYTTKGESGGTGLGLAVVYGAVEMHGGRIDVESEPGQGSRFRVWLPAIEGPSPTEAGPGTDPDLRAARGGEADGHHPRTQAGGPDCGRVFARSGEERRGTMRHRNEIAAPNVLRRPGR